MPTPTIAVKESRADLLEIGPSTGLSGFKLVYVIGKGLYEWQTGDQSGNVPGGNGGDNWIAPSEDTSGKSGAWERLTPGNTTGDDGNVVTGTAGADGQLVGWNGDGDAVDSGFNVFDEDDMASDSDAAVPTQQSVKAYTDSFDQQRAQAWVNFNGTGTVSIRDHYNVSSITDNGTGDYTINFSSDLADTNYAVVGTIQGNGTVARGPPGFEYPKDGVSAAKGSARILCFVGSTSSVDGAVDDSAFVSVAIFGGN